MDRPFVRRPDRLLVTAVVVWVSGVAFAVFGTTGTGASRLVSDVAIPLLGVIAGVAIARAARRVLVSRARLAWQAFAIAVFVYAAGSTPWLTLDLTGVGIPASTADFARFAFYPIILVAMLVVPTARTGRNERVRMVINSLIVTIGGGIVILHAQFAPDQASTLGQPSSATLALIYAVGDLVLLFGVSATALRRPTDVDARALAVLFIALVFMFLGDLSEGPLSPSGSATTGTWSNVLSLTTSFLTVVAAFFQANPKAASNTDASVRMNRWLAMLPYLGLAGGFGVLVSLTVGQVGDELAIVQFGTIALTILVLVRQELVLRENSRLLALQAHDDSEARFNALTSNTSDAMVLVDRDGIVRDATAAMEHVLGLAPVALVGRPIEVLAHADDAERIRTLITEVVAGRSDPRPVEWRTWDGAGAWRQVETVAANLLDDPRVGHIVLTTRDVGERKILQNQLAHVALHDRLTGLPNRALFQDRVEQALAGAGRAGRQTSLLVIRLDGLKRVNESIGFAAGDALIQHASMRLANSDRAADTGARLGGDEFGILLDGDTPSIDAVLLAEGVLDRLRRPIIIAGSPIQLTASVGVATAGPGEGGALGLIRKAEVARSVAQDTGHDQIVVFETAMQDAAEGRFELEADLRRAVERNEFVLQYQPIVDLDTGEVVAAEALVRWEHPTRGRIAPGAFIPLAEETGLIDPIGAWVLSAALAEVALWAKISPGKIRRVAVNVAAHQLADPQLALNIQAALARAKAAPGWLTIEITESVFVHNTAMILEQMHAIRAMGVAIALDDFGTGYSSLAYLQQFPMSYIKIDRSFVTPLNEPGRTGGIAGAVVDIARALEMTAIAEGIETPLQLKRLRELGCTRGQGFLLSRPIDADAMRRLILDPMLTLPTSTDEPAANGSTRPRRRRIGNRRAGRAAATGIAASL